MFMADVTIEQQAQELLAEAVQVLPLDDGGRDYYIVSLIVTVQRFRVGPEFETAEDAEWYAGQLRHALSFLTRAIARPASSDEEAWRDLAIANGDIVDEIREIIGLKGKPGNVVEAVRELAALRVQGEGWRPIESAPKDGVYQDGHNHYSAYILVCSGHYDTPRRARWWFRDDSDSSDFIADGGVAVYPTHWMPLPEPPTCDILKGG